MPSRVQRHHPCTPARAALFAVLVGAAPGLAADQAGQVSVHDPWVRATPPATEVSAGYLELHNTGGSSVTLTGGEAGFSGALELHDHTDDEGVMRMREMEEVRIGPGERVAFEPGGRHIMFLSLQDRLEPGEQVRYALRFEDGTTLDVEADVRRAGSGSDHGNGHHH